MQSAREPLGSNERCDADLSDILCLEKKVPKSETDAQIRHPVAQDAQGKATAILHRQCVNSPAAHRSSRQGPLISADQFLAVNSPRVADVAALDPQQYAELYANGIVRRSMPAKAGPEFTPSVEVLELGFTSRIRTRTDVAGAARDSAEYPPSVRSPLSTVSSRPDAQGLDGARCVNFSAPTTTRRSRALARIEGSRSVQRSLLASAVC